MLGAARILSEGFQDPYGIDARGRKGGKLDSGVSHLDLRRCEGFEAQDSRLKVVDLI